jgi:DNA-binding CsgD family transcriptional regulator
MHIANGQFSKREKDVIQLLLQGKGNKQIAFELGITKRTVEFHLRNIYVKLGVNTRSEAILKFTESHLRETTGDFLLNSTVENFDDSTENESKSISRRISMKKLFSIIGGLLAVILVAAVVVLNRPAAMPTTPVEQLPATNFSTTETLPPTDPVPVQPANVAIPAHTVNGYTAVIESYYADSSHILFQVRITGDKMVFGNKDYYSRIGSPNIYDENGVLINTSNGWGPAIDPFLFQFEFVPVTLLKGDHLKGQFAFEISDAPAYDQILAKFRFDFDVQIYPESIYSPKQVTSANGIDILLDQVTVTPAFTNIYLCFPSPSFADWNIGSQSTLKLGELEAAPYNFRLLFDSALGGDRRAGSEPYWAPPTKDGRCIKSGFPIGSSIPTTLTLTIPSLEKSAPDVLLTDQLILDYPSLSAKDAYYKFLEEHDHTYKGPWVFTMELKP